MTIRALQPPKKKGTGVMPVPRGKITKREMSSRLE